MKKIIAALLAVALLLTSGVFVMADSDEIKVVFNGEEVTFEEASAPMLKNHQVMVEIETICDKLMSSVQLNENNKIITCMRDFDKVFLKIGSDVATVKNEILRMEVPVTEVGENVMVPLQFIVEAYGGEYTWDAGTQTANITIADATQEPMKFFKKMIMPYDDPETEGVDGITVSANDLLHQGADKDLVIDGDYNTRWSASNQSVETQHIIFDLGKTTTVCGVGLSWFTPTSREYTFAVEVSVDGVNYTEVIAKRTNMKMSSLESFGFDPIEAQYVKVIGYGEPLKQHTHVTEMRVFVPDDSADGVDFDLD